MNRCSEFGSPSAAVPTRSRPHSRLLLVLALCAIAVSAALAGGCSGENSVVPVLAPKQKPTQPSAADLQQLKDAKAAAAAVLADVEVCEAEVLSGPQLDDLAAKSALAHASVEAFSRTKNAKLIPAATAAIALADKRYADCCKAWRADDRAANALWNGRGPGTGKKSLDDCRHPERYEPLWRDAALDLGAARVALREATLQQPAATP